MFRIAVLDACVLYPVVLRDFFITLATAKLYEPRWTHAIHDEWIRSVIKNRPNITRENLLRVRQLMDEAVPQALINVLLPEAVVLPQLRDPNDKHVILAAIAAKAAAIVTFNLRDFPIETLKLFNITAIHPDDFVSDFTLTNPDQVLACLELQRARFRNPPYSNDELLDILEKRGLSRTVKNLRSMIPR
jgi:predicted nucleic acid-binding protein